MTHTGWPEVALGAVATIERSGIAPDAIERGTTYVGLENITSEGRFVGQGPVESGDLASQKFRFSTEHVLYGKLRPYLAKIACPEFPGICSTDILPLRPGPRLDRRFLFHFLRQPSEVARATSLATGASLPRLSPQSLARLTITLPPIEEQRRIAAILDQADELRVKRRASLNLVESLTDAIFLDLFGDPESNPTSLPTVALSDVVGPGTIVTYGIVQAGEEFPDGVPYIRTGDIVGGQIAVDRLRRTDPALAARFRRSRVSAGDIVMSIRATVGTTALVPSELDGANLTQGTARISPGPSTCGSFLLAHLRTAGTQRWIQRQVKGATFREITLKRLRELPIMVAPLVDQRKFDQRVQRVTRLISRMDGDSVVLDTLFASLQHRAFHGEL